MTDTPKRDPDYQALARNGRAVPVPLNVGQAWSILAALDVLLLREGATSDDLLSCDHRELTAYRNRLEALLHEIDGPPVAPPIDYPPPPDYTDPGR